MSFKGSMTWTAPPDTLRRDLGKIVKKGLQDSVEHWHGEILPGHFDRSAHVKYGYQQRKQEYILRKMRRTGQSNDLVFTGALKKAAIRSIRISGSNKQARGVLTLPKYAYYYKPGTPNKAAELIAITEPEMQLLAQVLDKTLQQSVDANRELKTITK